MNARIADLIREGRPDEITDAIGEGEFFGMQTFEQALIERVLAGELEAEIAADAATNQHDFLVALDRETEASPEAGPGRSGAEPSDPSTAPELGQAVVAPATIDPSVLRVAAPR